ncbi:MAG: hypothetical protein A2Z98_15625 [Spirochaetes bacterium GWB1_27_13]|nr:MAG: hypothetical protein A2Z98_15625 [Spirochaetes bacterium GWB1_27_13]
MKKILVFFLVFFNIFFSYSEKWVGQVATYQLLEGSKMSNGDSFNVENLTAACNGFKLGANVTVTNVKSGKQVLVTITDRIKSESNYFILLTPKAAKELDLAWETSLVVVDGSFSDVNSTEILNVNGLVSEGTVDEEKFKKFPEINWPNGDKNITNKIMEKDDDLKEETVIPKDDIIKIPPEKDEKVGYDKEEKLIPPEKKNITPEKIMRIYAIDEDVEENPEPRNQIKNIPNLKEKFIDKDIDTDIVPKKEIKIKPQEKTKKIGQDTEDNPKIDKKKIPKEKQNLIDSEDITQPKKFIEKTPTEKEKKIGEDKDAFPNKFTDKKPLIKENDISFDNEDKINPKKDKINIPEKQKNQIGEESYKDKKLENPKDEKTNIPDKQKNQIGEESYKDKKLEDPKKDKVNIPEKQKNQIGEDSYKTKKVIEKLEDPKKYKTKTPQEKKNKISDEGVYIPPKKEIITKETPKIEWLTVLPKGKIYVRFSTTYEKEEGERRLILFKSIFKNVVGLKENSKYILLVGPIDKKNVDKVIKGIRGFGYKDAYIIEK